ncbi:MAG TPA: DUF885 family protein [Gemmatimonadales bacterium]|nr:DUF885 family protein [Gemmatimonadales bacterium]
MLQLPRWTGAIAAAAAGIALSLSPAPAQGRGDAAPGSAAAADVVPSDLRPLLAPHHSEMRLVVTRYTADRALLAGNYAGPSGRGGRGRGGAPPDSLALPQITISPARIAHLERFDLAWQAAVKQLDTSHFTPEARVDRDSLLTAIANNLTALQDDAKILGTVTPLLPFAPDAIGLIEARLRLEDMNAEDAARMVTKITHDIATAQAQFTSGPMAQVADRQTALRAAGAVETLRSNFAAWFGFYNGYDPLFTWWMGLPYKHLDDALGGYAIFLRTAASAAHGTPAGTVAAIPPAAPPQFSEVPDLAEIVALPQDEMTDIVQRFRGVAAGRGGGRGNGAAPPPVRDSTYYNDWLAALKTLDFDHLSRNAQVDYLYLKKRAEIGLGRVDVALPPNPPRKTDDSGIPGAARGRDGLIRDLQDELIPYTPEQLIALAEKEFAWCDKEMLKASHDMGYGDNWKAALEKTKTMHVPPGGQPAMIRDLIFQAIDYLRAHDLVTVPEVDVESQRMSMMTPQEQLASPFFLGGSQIQVSYPTDSMEFDAREQSMRGNNRPWSHATAFHEMIPGHNLSGYYNARYAAYRANLGASGPFYTEGWAVYWELTMYDKGYDTTPEERVGALFWRMHRCARIIFSLRFHMGQWSPGEAVQFLIDRVGHEPDNARAEVVRSFQGNYGPLYQAGYLLGALQLRGLRHELVDSRQMTEKAFHDEILRQGNMPIALLRLALGKEKLTRDMSIDWKFYGDLPDK